MKYRYNSPPNWPTPPTGWEPADDWRPDTSWGPAPAGWQFWVPVEGELVTERLDVLPVGATLSFNSPRSALKGKAAGATPAAGGTQAASSAALPRDTATEPEPKSSHKGLIIIIAIAVVLLAVGAYFLNRVGNATTAENAAAAKAATTSAAATQPAKPTPSASTPQSSAQPSASASATEPATSSPTTTPTTTPTGSPSVSSDATTLPSSASVSPSPSNTSGLNVSLKQTDYAGLLATIYPKDAARESSSTLGTVDTTLLKAEWVRDPATELPGSPTTKHKLLVLTVKFEGKVGTYLPNANDFQVVDVTGKKFEQSIGYTLLQPVIPTPTTNGRTVYGQIAFDVEEGAYDIVFTMHSAQPVQWHITL